MILRYLIGVAPVITSSPPPATGQVGVAYNHTCTAAGTTPMTFTVTAGGLPTGLTLSSGGVISGTPSAAGTFSGTITAANGTLPDATQDFLIAISPATYTITASAGTGGSISPTGAVAVDSGASQSFSITPNPGYVVGDVTVDTVSVGAVTSHTFTDVTANHTISAVFTAVPEIAVEQPLGTNLPDGASIDCGTANIRSAASAITITVRNLGTADLTGLAVTKDGANAADFTIGSLGATTVAAGSSTTLSVTFTPGGTGSRAAAIHIASNDADENPFDLDLTGTGTIPPPLVTTGSASGITASVATLSGTVNANGFMTTAWFEYGLNTDYGSMAGVTLSPADGSTAQDVSATVRGLQPDTTYHYRLAATNGGGTSPGADRTFTTYPTVPFNYTTANGAVTITGYTGSANEVIIPSTINGLPVTGIGNFAFYNHTNLTGITIPDSVTHIGSYAFHNCTGLTSVIIPNSVTRIGDGAFSYCLGLTGVTLGSGVTRIGDLAFSMCAGLVSITIPAGVSEIGNHAFAFCTGLTSVTLGAGVTSIGEFAFCACDQLTEITIPAAVASIGESAFENCAALARAVFVGNAPVMGAAVFDGTAGGFAVYHSVGATGFTGPPWNGYTVNVTPATPVAAWLLDHGLPADADLRADSNGDGVSLLMAYALKLDPHQNLSNSLPQAVVGAGQMSIDFYAGSAGVTYTVETSTDLQHWSSADVTVSAPDANQVRTATVPMTGQHRYLRLVVGY